MKNSPIQRAEGDINFVDSFHQSLAFVKDKFMQEYFDTPERYEELLTKFQKIKTRIYKRK